MKRYIKSQTLYKWDKSMVGDEFGDQTYTLEDLEQLYLDNIGDPVVDSFEDFDSWFETTRRNGMLVEI